MRLLQWSIFKRTAVNTVITFVLLGAIATTTQVLNQLYRLIEATPPPPNNPPPPSANFPPFAFRLYAFLVAPTV